jgi:Uracil phosphoribosyltransferase
MIAENVNLVSHPLVQHKLSLMRERDRSIKGFRELLNEIGMLLCYEVTRDLPLELVDIETPLSPMKAPKIAGKKLTFAPILRAGVGFLDGMLALVPSARVAHIGLYRDPETLEAVEYFFKAPQDFVGSHRDHDGSHACDGKFGLRRGQPSEGARCPRHAFRLPACSSRRHRAIPQGTSRRSDLDRRRRREAERSRLYPARPRRRRRQDVRHEVRAASERLALKACPALDAGWGPVRVKKARQNKKLDAPFRFNRNGKAPASSMRPLVS